MADSAPDPKVEDVLTSVRRLVSGELQRRPSRPTPGDAGALVLTSAQRVAPADKPKAADKLRSANRSLEQRIAELEAAVDRGSQEFEPDGSEDQSENRPDRIVYTRPRDAEPGAERSALRLSQIALIETGPASEESEAKPRDAVPFRHGSRSPEAPIAEDVPSIRPTSEVRAFSNPDDVVAGIEERIARQGQGEDMPILARASAQDDPPEDGENLLRDAEGAEDAENAEDLEENTFEEELSTAVAASLSSSGAPESDAEEETEDFLDQDEVLAYVDDAEPDADSPPEVEAAREEPASDKATDDVAAALDALPDEDAMRLLVGRLIREELQGKLGERITHNVRKLVRREILRVLESRDLV